MTEQRDSCHACVRVMGHFQFRLRVWNTVNGYTNPFLWNCRCEFPFDEPSGERR